MSNTAVLGAALLGAAVLGSAGSLRPAEELPPGVVHQMISVP